MWKWMIFMLAVVFSVAFGLGYYKYHQIQTAMAMNASFRPPAVTVTSATASLETWQESINSVGQFSSYQGVHVSAEEEGKIILLPVESGTLVQTGDLLAQQDVAVEEAQIKSSVARAELAVASLNRLQKMSGTGAVAQKELDDADAELKTATAEAEALKATIERKTIRAPFTGRVGIRQAQLGQYLSKGDPLILLQALNPIYLDFSVPQQSIALISTGQSVQVRVDAFKDQVFDAKITAISPEINLTTRTIQIQATMENKDETLRPGMFATVSTLLKKEEKHITLPSTAINHAPYGNSVFIIGNLKDPQGKEYLGVRQEFVQTGPTRGDQVAILKGVKEGEEVVTSGLFKLQPNAEVKVDNTIMPANQSNPNPADT
jgi:membrane fusion protein, multidrug efflux system